MICSRFFLIIVFILLMVIADTSFASNAKFIHNTAQLHGRTADGASIIVTACTKEYSSAFPYSKGFRWGVELRVPRSLIISLEVVIGGKEIFVPLSAYFDLTNPREISLETTQTGFRIIIQGGDAATSYEAELIFEKNYIQRRRVSHSEFPDVAWEETVYSFNVNKEPPSKDEHK